MKLYKPIIFAVCFLFSLTLLFAEQVSVTDGEPYRTTAQDDENVLKDITVDEYVSSGTQTIVASNTITSNSMISGSADITMIAGTRIMLTTGFNVEQGAKFKAFLDDVAVIKNAKASDVEAMEPSEMFSMYPNPASGIVTLKLANDNLQKVISIYTLQGSLIEQLETFEGNVELNLENQPAGIYNISVKVGDEVSSEMLILK